MVTRKQKTQHIFMATWVVQRVEALTASKGEDLADSYEPLFVDQFSNNNDFAASLHESGIAGVPQDNDYQGDDHDDTYEDPSNPARIALDPTEAQGEIVGVAPPEHPALFTSNNIVVVVLS